MLAVVAIVAGLFAQLVAASSRCYYGQRCFPSTADWTVFNSTVGGRLVAIRPLQSVCYVGSDLNLDACADVNINYSNDTYRSNHINAYEHINFEECGSDSCTNTLRVNVLGTCGQGSVSPYGVMAQSSSDVVSAVNFAKFHDLKVAIKNTGHDYKGRSAAKDSFMIWTHGMVDNMYRESFVPRGCSASPAKALTFGAGVQFDQAYKFADANHVTLVGGDSSQVGPVGGWVQGAGHGVLTPRYGLGVDNVLEFEIVTADGRLRTANECTNSDLFWALRGGGGGTWGVVTKASFLAHPAEELAGLTLNATGIAVPHSSVLNLVEAFARISPALATINFGGVVVIGPKRLTIIGVAPIANKSALKDAFAPFAAALISGQIFADKTLIEDDLLVPSYPTYTSFLDFHEQTFGKTNELEGTGMRLTSRLIPNDLFVGDDNLSKLASALGNASAPPLSLHILMSTPVSVPDTNRTTSVTPAWRSSLWHSFISGSWPVGTSLKDQKTVADTVNYANDILIRLAPNSGAYQNEANIDEPNHEQTFWGDNIGRLKTIKKKYDPDNFFAVWHGVGWKGSGDADFVCYDKYN